MSITFEDPPCQLSEILEFTFNFKNLQNFLSSLVNNNREFLLKIERLSNKIEEIDSMRGDLKETNFRIKNCEQKNQIFEYSLDNHQRKIIDLESKFEDNKSVKN